MLYTEEAVRDNIRNREGKRVFYLGKTDTLTPGARDYLRRERIEILDANMAKPDIYRLLGGGYMNEKPEHMTHLQGDLLVHKSHPRIAFRGAIDMLEGDLLLCQAMVDVALRDKVGEILEAVRRLLRCEVLDELVTETVLCGLNQEQIRKQSHFPQEYYGQPHFMPQVTDGLEILWLNRCRCAARNAELAAIRAFVDAEGVVSRLDILQALNRISSMLYLLMIQERARKHGKTTD